MWAKLKPQIWQWRGVLLAVPNITALVIAIRLTGLLQLLELAALDQFFLLRPRESADTRSHVNLAARIESYTVGGQILISENTCKDANIDLQIAGQLQIEPKGIKHPVTICEIRGIGGKYNLFLPQDDEKMFILNQEVPVEYSILQGKHTVGTVFLGALISLSEKRAQLRSPHSLELLSNLKLKLLMETEMATEEHIYAKVIQQSNVDEHLFMLRFTSVLSKAVSDDKPLGVYAILNALRQAG
jgi:adenylate cyclase